ncbi:BIP5 [Symbiodinium pilosum]|uniref:BIP5 protein n=1 Tax=Symbiodinium pilosum TaxID=2952 RepID=A0A812TBM6_SYMPI|nr:BIP5 [Symbiodinium pilosum]
MDLFCFPKLVDPAETFLCCLPLGVGVKLLMWPHQALTLYTVAAAAENLIAGDTGAAVSAVSDRSAVPSSTVFPGWQLPNIQVPIITAGLWGVYHRSQASKKTTQPQHVRKAQGQAFACGVARSVSTAVTVVFLYFIYIVWSWCEDVEGSGAADVAIASLLDMAEGKRPQLRMSGWLPAQWAVADDCPPFLKQYDGADKWLDVEASIISGAGIFYGSISNAMKREAKMVGQFVEDELGDIERYATGMSLASARMLGLWTRVSCSHT